MAHSTDPHQQLLSYETHPLPWPACPVRARTRLLAGHARLYIAALYISTGVFSSLYSETEHFHPPVPGSTARVSLPRARHPRIALQDALRDPAPASAWAQRPADATWSLGRVPGQVRFPAVWGQPGSGHSAAGPGHPAWARETWPDIPQDPRSLFLPTRGMCPPLKQPQPSPLPMWLAGPVTPPVLAFQPPSG